MRKCLMGIGIILFAILLNMCSTGIDVVSLAIGIVGLSVTIAGALSKSD